MVSPLLVGEAGALNDGVPVSGVEDWESASDPSSPSPSSAADSALDVLAVGGLEEAEEEEAVESEGVVWDD